MEIARRILKLREMDRDIDVAVKIFLPQEMPDQAWSCRYEIDWPDRPSSKEIYGVDAAQALIIALQIIGVELYTSEHHKSGKLFFDKPGNGYGFPPSASIHDLLQGDDAKYL